MGNSRWFFSCRARSCSSARSRSARAGSTSASTSSPARRSRSTLKHKATVAAGRLGDRVAAPDDRRRFREAGDRGAGRPAGRATPTPPSASRTPSRSRPRRSTRARSARARSEHVPGRVAYALDTRYGVAERQLQLHLGRAELRQDGRRTARCVAIIASLLAISAYIALRFQWKYAVPVMIALMHDLLITAGVYALTGRQVTASTVAALLTILGYSLYDTIIVFDRVRENVAEDAERRVLADREPLDVRGADAVAGDEPVHAAADPRAAALRRLDAEGLRLRAAGRRRLGCVLVDLHRLAGADALEGARAGVPPSPRADRGGERRRRAGVRDRGCRGARDRGAPTAAAAGARG